LGSEKEEEVGRQMLGAQLIHLKNPTNDAGFFVYLLVKFFKETAKRCRGLVGI